jgi:hypothetical protein
MTLKPKYLLGASVAILILLTIVFMARDRFLFVPGGGGSTETAPDFVKAGDPILIELELSVWGSGGNIKGRYTEIVSGYRLEGEKSYKTAETKFLSSDGNTEKYELIIPPFSPNTTGLLEYQIDMKLDGVPNHSLGTKKIRIMPNTDSVGLK